MKRARSVSDRMTNLLRATIGVLLMGGASLPLVAFAAQPPKVDLAARKLGASGLPVPRFVSLKADEVNVRRGPGWDHGVAWVFHRAGLPVEVIEEFDVWRKIRDSEGAEGWVLGTLLSGRRTVLVAPWKTTPQGLELRNAAASTSDVTVRLTPQVLGDVKNCDGQWCQITTGNYSGFISQDLVWGVYPGEKVE
jgi:SH3-like domain-containing protein